MKKLAQIIGYQPKENSSNLFIKTYNNGYCIELDFDKEIINYGNLIICENKTTSNFSQPENFVVLECVDKLLEKGYKPQNIILEKTWAAGHGTSGRLDICVTNDDGSEYLLIECKTLGKEFEKEFAKMKINGGQLFTYFKFSNKAKLIMLYASELNKNQIVYRNEIIKIEEDYKVGDVKDFYEKWNKLTKDNGVFEDWVKPYDFESKALTINDLVEIKPEDSSFIFNRFLEILRHNVVSDKGNAFNKIFTLFLCKIFDEKDKEGSNEELQFQWFDSPFTYEKVYYEKDNHISFQIRLTDLYKQGMYEFLEKRVTDFSETEFNNKYDYLKEADRSSLLSEFRKIRLEKNNEFAIKDVFDEESFNDNAVVVKEVVELLQKFKIRYTKKQQYLSDFFELLLTTGLKQESGQFFTPVPVAQFIIKSLPIDTILEEKINKGIKNDLLPFVMDYAAGSGHFLTETMHEMQRLLDQKKDTSKLKVEARKLLETAQINNFDWALDYVYGIEKDYRLVKVGKVGCYLHGDGLANVIHSDGLARFGHPDYKGKLLTVDKIFKQDNKEFDIIVSNPPYSVSSFKNTTSKYYKADDFELYSKLTENSSEIECLFIERTKQLLKDGGVAGIILPSSILSNTGIYSKSREIILQNFDIIAIAELGSNTFMATGTNTVTLFLRRKDNYKYIHLKHNISVFFTNKIDVTLNGIEKPVTKYLNHVWETISFDDYTSLLKQEPNNAITAHEIYTEYRKKLKYKNEKEFWTLVLDKEADKLLYFIIALPQKIVLVKSGEKDAEKRFLGYEFSNRRGSEGIHAMQRGKNIEDCTQMFDPEIFDNPTKASTYIYKAFSGDYDFAIDNAMQNNVSRHNLVDMMTFDRVEFEKNISLSVKKKVNIESKWELIKISEVCETSSGGTPLSGNYDYYDKGNILWINSGEVKHGVITNSENKITELGLKNSSAKIFPVNTVLLAMYGATAGQVGILGVEASTNQAVCGILPSKKLLPFFLYNYLKTQYENILNLRSGVARLNISQDVVKNMIIPFPPIEIQQKIVDEIEVLESKETKAKEEVESLKFKSNEIFENIKTSNKVSLVDISENLDFLRKPITKGYREKGQIPYYGASGVVDYVSSFILDDYVLLVSEDGANLKARTSPIAFTSNGKIWVNNHAHILKFKEKATHKLAEIYINKTDISQYITGQAQPKLNQQNLNNIKIPLPPLSEQKKIVSEIEKIEAKINDLETQIAEIPKLKEAILKKYL